MDISLRAKSPALIGQSNIAALRRGSRRCGPGRASVEGFELRVGPPPAAGVRTGGYPPLFSGRSLEVIENTAVANSGNVGSAQALDSERDVGRWPVAASGQWTATGSDRSEAHEGVRTMTSDPPHDWRAGELGFKGYPPRPISCNCGF